MSTSHLDKMIESLRTSKVHLLLFWPMQTMFCACIFSPYMHCESLKKMTEFTKYLVLFQVVNDDIDSRRRSSRGAFLSLLCCGNCILIVRIVTFYLFTHLHAENTNSSCPKLLL